MPESEDLEQAVSDEYQEVLHWRVHRFLDLGFNLRQSRALASGEADWHGAEGLLLVGCPVEVAFDLLS